MTKFLWYLLFAGISIPLLVIYVCSIYILMKKLEQPLWLEEAVAFAFASDIYFYGLLLARYSSVLIPGFYFLAAQVPIIVNATFNAATVAEDRGCYVAEISWAGKCMRPTWLPTAEGIAALLVTATIALLVPIVYFTTPVPSTTATIAFIRFPMLAVFLASLIFLPGQVSIAQSENLSVASRRRLLSVSLAQLVPTSMILATLLWTFSSSAKSPDHAGVRFHLTYFPIVLSILAAYFVITFLLPSITGSTRGKRWQSLLLERRTDALTEAVQILRTPKADFHIPALGALVTKLQKQEAVDIKDDECIERGLQLDKLKTEQNISSPTATVRDKAGYYRTTSDSTDAHSRSPSDTKARTELEEGALDPNSVENNQDYYLARPHDPRFQYRDWLLLLLERLQMTASDLQTKSEPAAELRTALAWADSYDGDRRDLSEKAGRTKTNAVGAAIVGTLVTSVLSVFFTGFGSWLWNYVAQTLPS
jgi:hypothetical protein